MANIIEVDNAPDGGVLDVVHAFFGDLSYLEESQSKRYMATRYYSKLENSLSVPHVDYPEPISVPSTVPLSFQLN